MFGEREREMKQVSREKQTRETSQCSGGMGKESPWFQTLVNSDQNSLSRVQ